MRARRALGKEAKIGVAPEGIQVSGMHLMKQTGEKIREALGPVSEVVINQIRSITNLIQEPLKEELPRLAEKFTNYRKGFGEFSNKYIKMPLEHIFGEEFVFDKKGIPKNISGFHHDFMGMLENSGLIEFRNKVVGKFGEYQADMFVNGKIIPKTFFPQEWSREQVAEKIFEAYEHFLKQYDNERGLASLIDKGLFELMNDGKYHIIGQEVEGMKIEMFITKKGLIKTAYPLI